MKSHVLISGATGGLGKAFAAECASRGWDIVLTDISFTSLNKVAQGLRRLHNVEIQCFPCDLTNPQARTDLWALMTAEGLTFHSLINVAGLDFEGEFDQQPIENLLTILRLNNESTLEMLWQVLRHRDASRTLRIINVASLAGFFPMPLKATYAASKRFLLDLSIALNRELRTQNASVTALCPAGMPTTPDCTGKINSQGVAGRWTARNVGDVARGTVNAAMKGKSVYIPGGINRVLSALGGLFPAEVVAAAIYRRWGKTRAEMGAQTPLNPMPSQTRAESLAKMNVAVAP